MNSATDVIGRCYEEYRVFDKACCLAALSSLKRQAALAESQPTLQSDEDISQGSPSVNSSDGDFVFYDFGEGEDALPIETARVDTQSFEADATFQPHPAYELCTAIARNIKVGDDPDYMPFAPFSDDPTFKFLDYNNEYTWFAWQPPKMLDPDRRFTFALSEIRRPEHEIVEIVSIEALSLLLDRYGMLPEVVDELGLFPARYPAAPSSAVPRLSRLRHKRDFPTELPPGWTLSLKYAPPHKSGPSGIIDSLLSSFCHNPNCLTGYCTVHMWDAVPPPIPPPLSNLSPAVLDSAAGDPCGKDCFLAAATSLRDINTVSPWTEDDKELLNSVLTHSPDALPCDLAVICRKPCFEVAKHRRQYFDNVPRPGKERPAKRHAKKVTSYNLQGEIRLCLSLLVKTVDRVE
ncbi:hypothetical protein MD484_g2499, partial [Candolleomyces efflorescens]